MQTEQRNQQKILHQTKDKNIIKLNLIEVYMDLNVLLTRIRYSNKRRLLGGLFAIALLSTGFVLVSNNTFQADTSIQKETSVIVTKSTNSPLEKTIIIHAKGQDYLGTNAHFNVYADNIKIGQTKVTKNYTNYIFYYNQINSPKQIKIQYNNDFLDRSLYVDKISIDGEIYMTNEANYAYGLVSAGTTSGLMPYNGNLKFDL